MSDRDLDQGTDQGAIAIVGMAGRFPGARDLAEFWENLRRGVESISRFEADGPVDPRWVGAAGVLDGADLFDAPFFHFTPREAERLDPQHRLFLECAWEALEDAACDPARFAGAIGVFGGASLNTYLHHNLLPAGDSLADPQVAIASDKDFLTTRVSYKLNLTGPSLDVQTACSTSLVAVVLACQSLLTYQCDLALAGGASVREPQRSGYLYQEQGILSPDGRCRPFDAAARGTVPGSGVGVVALKRLEDAVAAGDPIRAVIRGAALNNDGAAKVGYTAPSVAGQAEVVGMALAIAGVDPADVGFIEAHGTATPMGDPIEVRALERVFGARPAGSCVLGSVKANLGHLDAAAGIAGLIKTVLALEHGEIPPTLHFKRPNPEIGLEHGPFRVNAGLETWTGPRRAGVSSFGIGGTNAHVVVEGWEGTDTDGGTDQAKDKTTDGHELLVLSARSEAALDEAGRRLARHLEAQPEVGLAAVARTLRSGRRALEVRRFAVVSEREEAARVLAEPAMALTARVPAGEREVVFLFPGQGAQHAGMAAGLYEREPVFREAIDECAAALASEGIDLKRLLAGGDLTETAAAQPALFAVEVALARLWISWGVKPAAVLGHSLGEYAAATAAGFFRLEDAARLVARRGRLMQGLEAGAMLAVSLGEAELRPRLDGLADVEIAALNAPDRTVAAGPPEAVERLRLRLAEAGVEARTLAARHAFHTRTVEAIQGELVAEVRRALANAPAAETLPWLSNLTGTWGTPEQARDAAAWSESLRRPVRFSPAVAELLGDPKRLLLEVGPGQTLAGLVRRHGGEAVSSLPHPDAPRTAREGLLDAMGRLWIAGVEVDWNAAFGSGRRVALPTYPFERQRYWVEPPTAGGRTAGPVTPEEAGPVLQAPLWKQALPATGAAFDPSTVWLVVHDGDVRGGASLLLQRLQAERLETVAAVPGPAFSRLAAGAYALDLASAADLGKLLDSVPGELRIVWMAGARPDGLAEALSERGLAPRVDLVLHGAAEPAGGSDPARAALLGSASLPGFRALDVEPAPAAGTPAARAWTDRVAGELAAPRPASTVVALRGGRRWIEAWEDVAPAPRTETTGPGPSEIERLAREAEEAAPPQPAALAAEATDPLVAAHALQVLRDSGVDTAPGAEVPLPLLRTKLELSSRYEKLMGFLLDVLGEDGVAEIAEDSVRFLPAAAAAPTPAEARRDLSARFPGFAPLHDLIDHCGRHYRQALSGKISGLSVIYPEGGSGALAGAVRQGEGEGRQDTTARLLRDVLATAAHGRSPANPLRVLEVGGGHGTLTAALLPALAEGSAEYWFTDVGRSFVLRAEERARASGRDGLRFGVLDITKDPGGQGFPLGSFDAVVGSDVVHATPRLSETLANLRSLLAPGGLLGLVETVRPLRWGTFVWGLTDGWWSFEDSELRRGSPLLGPEAWERLLASTGFAEVRACANAGESALLVARRPRERQSGSIAVRTVPDLTAAAALPLPAGRAALATADPAAFRCLAARAEAAGRSDLLALLWDGDEADASAAADLLAARGIAAARVSGRQGVAERPVLEAPAPRTVASLHGRPPLRNPYVAPRDETERALVDIWSRALGIERIGVDDNFLELGGDSLIGLQVVHAVQERFAASGLHGRSFSLYEHPTVAAIARFVSDGEGGEADPFELRSSRGERRRERSLLKRTRA